MDCINSLKKRAQEMIEGNNEREIGPEEIYKIICEWAESCVLNEKLNEELREEKSEKNKLIKELENYIKKECEMKCIPVNDDAIDSMRLLAEIRDMFRKTEHEKEQEKLENRYNKLEEERKKIEQEMGYIRSDIIRSDLEYWNRRG